MRNAPNYNISRVALFTKEFLGLSRTAAVHHSLPLVTVTSNCRTIQGLEVTLFHEESKEGATNTTRGADRMRTVEHRCMEGGIAVECGSEVAVEAEER